MEILKDISALLQFFNSSDQIRDEVIIFPIDEGGYQLLEFLHYTNFLRKVCCVAAPKVGIDNTEQKFSHELPLIPFDYLLHFRESATFIVAGNEQYYQHSNEELTRYGCKKLIFISNELQAQIRNALQSMASTGQILMWYMNHFSEKIKWLEHKIEEQNEISEVNTKAFAEYRNAFRGKKVVILGNGPTLNYYKPDSHSIHIGLNYACKQKHIPVDYLFTMDGRGMIKAPPPRILLRLTMNLGLIKFVAKYFAGNLWTGVLQAFKIFLKILCFKVKI